MGTKAGHTPVWLVPVCVALLQSQSRHPDSLKKYTVTDFSILTLSMFLAISKAGPCWYLGGRASASIQQVVCPQSCSCVTDLRFHLLLPCCITEVNRADLLLVLLVIIFLPAVQPFQNKDLNSDHLIFLSLTCLPRFLSCCAVCNILGTVYRQMRVQESPKPCLFFFSLLVELCCAYTVSPVLSGKYWIFCSCLWACPGSLVSGNTGHVYKIFAHCLDNIFRKKMQTCWESCGGIS